VVPLLVPHAARLLAVVGVGVGEGEGLGEGEPDEPDPDPPDGPEDEPPEPPDGEPDVVPPDPPEPPELDGGDDDGGELDEFMLDELWGELPQPLSPENRNISAGTKIKIRNLLRRARTEIFMSASSVQNRGRAE
jgi:hypothetical protein